jgi:hypothetical protein
MPDTSPISPAAALIPAMPGEAGMFKEILRYRRIWLTDIEQLSMFIFSPKSRVQNQAGKKVARRLLNFPSAIFFIFS